MKSLYKYLLNTLPRPLLIRISYAFKLLAPYIYGGDKVSCPVCERSFRKFLSYGSKVAHRENVLCPYDLTLERHRLMWYYLKNESDFFTASNLNLLHIAPEQCFHKKFKKQKNLNYLTGDLESPIADLHFDVHDIPLKDNSYDVIFCNHVLEHVKDDQKCMQELFRVMKKGGWGIFQVPIDYSREETYEDPTIKSKKERELHYWQKDHLRLYGLDYPKKLENAGFRVSTYNYHDHIAIDKQDRLRLNKEELLYIIHK